MVQSIDGLKRGTVLNNTELGRIFGGGNSGGIRKSVPNNLLILVSDHTKGLYDDKWHGDTLHYTGQGLSDDQSLEYKFNKDLNQANKTGIPLYLFEVFKRNAYIYHGPVRLVGQPYQAKQVGEDKKPRLAWVFPVRPIAGAPLPVQDAQIQETAVHHARQAKKLSKGDLRSRALLADGLPERRLSITTTFVRDEYVVEYVKRLAGGVCELCEQKAPFVDKYGEPFLEVHHVKWLSQVGKDAVANAVALCPNCHKRMHILADPGDVEKLKKRLKSRKSVAV